MKYAVVAAMLYAALVSARVANLDAHRERQILPPIYEEEEYEESRY